MMKENFEKWLIEQGYSTVTPKGQPSTVYDYLKRIEFVIREENLSSWQQLATNIDFYCRQYDNLGAKADLGKISHNAVISALKAFQRFLRNY